MLTQIGHQRNGGSVSTGSVFLSGTLTLAYLVGFSLIVTPFVGCDTADTQTENSTSDQGGDDHEHDHSFGPHRGHFFELIDLPYKTEWTHDDKFGVVRIFFLNEDLSEASVATEKVIVTAKGKETIEYELLAELPQEDGTSSVFVKKSQALLGAMSAGVSVSVEIDGKSYEGTIEPHIH